MHLILFPLEFELKSFLKALSEKNISFNKEDRLYRSQQFVCATAGHGKVNFALSTYRYIEKLSPDLVICAGSSGGLYDVSPREIVAATETVEHDFKTHFIKKDRPRFSGDETSLKRLKDRCKQGPIASGDEDIVTEKRAQEIFKETQALAVAWEGAGGAKAAALTDTPFLELRAVTDMCNESTVTDFKKNMDHCMENLLEVYLNLWR